MRLIATALLIAIVGCTGRGDSRSAQPDSSAMRETASPDSTSPAAVVAWIEGYYKAINERRYEDAYAHWEQDGKASGKTFDQFRRGFGETDHVQASVGPPGAIGAAAGSRYIEVPVRILARDKTGAQQTFVGIYTLRLSVVDGATPEQRSWHIYSAAVRRETP